jgi:phage shock protein PspC (stress-responsive transcriptional regulator)
MRKVTTINLNHNAWQIDEDAYEALRRYLEDAERALAGNPDQAEILADLEQAIADKIRVALGQYRSVVNAVEIERILKEMGPVPGDSGSAGPESTGGPEAGADRDRPRARRLYRVPDGQQWAGVCNGLATFAGVDVTWVRVAFILLTVFTGGFWLLTYLILMFVMPIASTSEQLSAARGQPFNAQELVDRARKKHQDFRASRARRARRGHWFSASSPAQPPREPGPAARIAGGVMLPVFTVLSAGWFALMAVAAIMVWHTYGQPGFDWPPGPGNLAHLPRWIPLVALAAIYAVLALPIGVGRRTALYYANGGHAHGWADAWSGLLWIALVVVVVVGAWMALPQLQEFLRHVHGWHAPTWAMRWDTI